MSESLSTIYENSSNINNYDFPVYDFICRKAIRTIKNFPASEIFNILKSMIINSSLDGSDLLFFINVSKYILPILTIDEINMLSKMTYKHIPLHHRYRHILINIFLKINLYENY